MVKKIRLKVRLKEGKGGGGGVYRVRLGFFFLGEEYSYQIREAAKKYFFIVVLLGGKGPAVKNFFFT